MVNKVLASKNEVDMMQQQLADLQSKNLQSTSTIRLSKDQLEKHRQMLARLIPDSEDFFSILYAIEKLSIQNGFIITDYVINDTKSKGETVTLSIQGQGDAPSFLRFIQSYPFEGGRYITGDTISLNSKDTQNSALNLTFYSKLASPLQKPAKPLSQDDINLLDKIAAKTSLLIQDPPVSTDYATKKNPFK